MKRRAKVLLAIPAILLLVSIGGWMATHGLIVTMASSEKLPLIEPQGLRGSEWVDLYRFGGRAVGAFFPRGDQPFGFRYRQDRRFVERQFDYAAGGSIHFVKVVVTAQGGINYSVTRIP